MIASKRWRIAHALYMLATTLALLPAWLLIASGETLSGQLVGVIPVALVLLVPAIVVSRNNARYRWLPAIPVLIVVAAAVTMLAQTPTGQAAPDANVRSVFLDGNTFDRWSVANVVPEVDQLELGTYLVAPVDPMIDFEQAARLRALVLEQYRPMMEDPAFRTLGSVMGAAYADRDVGHLYVYAPVAESASESDERRPVLLFLHGSAGNFKAYFHLWYQAAKKHGWLLVFPSFGFGNWQQPGGMEAIDRAYQYAIGPLGGDPDRVYLMALSNGGRGATRTFARYPNRYAGVVLVSAVLEPGPIQSVTSGYGDRPVLVLHGEQDRRIGVQWTRRSVGLLRERGADVTERYWPSEDHFLLFSRAEELRQTVAAWMVENEDEAGR